MPRFFFSIVILIVVSLQVFAIPQTTGNTNDLQTNTEKQAIHVGPFVFHESGENNPSEKSLDWPSEVLVPVLKIITWPLVILIIVWRFQKEIKGILGSVKTIKGKDYSVEMSERLSDQQKLANNPPPTSGAGSISADNMLGEFEKARAATKITPALEVIAQKIRDEVKKSKFTPDQQMELGVLAISRVALIADFWRIYNFIFGTQIELLQQLNTRPHAESDLQTFFEKAKERFPQIYNGSNHKVYINFLVTSDLIEVRDNNYVIAPKGKEFLVWCIENNLTLNKSW